MHSNPCPSVTGRGDDRIQDGWHPSATNQECYECWVAPIERVSDGEAHAAHDLLPLVYEQLRAAAQKQMAQERADHTLQATALVHEAYVRLSG